MYFIGQQWQTDQWGLVEIVWLEELDNRTVKVEYSVKGEKWPVAKIAHLDCERCMRFPIDVQHDNCKRPGERGHSKSHCTSSTCF